MTLEMPGSPDPSNAGLARRLAAICAFLPEFEAPGFTFGHWAGGEEGPDGAIQMPYYELGETARRFVAAVGANGWITPFDWMTWLGSPDGRALADDPARMERASVEDIEWLLTAIVRSERFGDGNLEGVFTSGLLARLLRRAQVLLEEELRSPQS
jgi:hypothetical protein